MARADGEPGESAKTTGGVAAGLSIYGYPQCPYCRRVLGAVAALGLEIELRDTLQDRELARELYDATGRTTVPVLRIDAEAEDGESVWLPESADIVDYLEERFRSRD
jgi:glutathione S-transferase